MLLRDRSKIKTEEDGDGADYSAGTVRDAKHKARVKDMAARMAVEAGFRRSGRSNDENGGQKLFRLR